MKTSAEARTWSQPANELHSKEGIVSDHWVLDYFRAIDSKDLPTVATAFAEDGTFRFGNSEPAVGRQQVEQAIRGFNTTIGGLRHDITGVWSGAWEGGEVKIVEARVTYTRKDGTRTEPLPVVSTLRMRGDRIQDYRIFMDIAPLFGEETHQEANAH
jgi:ketosteroid isomerase-like protein